MEIARGISALSWKRSWAIALANPWTGHAYCLGMLGTCLGQVCWISAQSLHGFWESPWGIPGRLPCEVLGESCGASEKPWPNAGSILGRLPWGVPGGSLASCGGGVENLHGKTLGRSAKSLEILAKSWMHAWATVLGFLCEVLQSVWLFCPNPGTILGRAHWGNRGKLSQIAWGVSTSSWGSFWCPGTGDILGRLPWGAPGGI